jgi:hypothetical protein
LAKDHKTTAPNLEGEMSMRQIIIAVAAFGIVALAAEGASAQQVGRGAPIKQNGQCWRHHGAGSDHLFGNMEACPQPASNTAAARTARKRS